MTAYLSGFPFYSEAQVDTTLQAPMVTVQGERLHGWQPGQEHEMIDSNFQSRASWSSLAETLAASSGMFIKQYGPANIATAGVRGLGAAYTNIFWHGLPLQHPMLGLVDLNLLPGFLFDEVLIVNGNNSPLWGGGAMGSAVHLQQQLPDKAGFRTYYQSAVGSFGRQQHGLAAGWQRQKWISDTRLFFQQAQNDYPYRTLSGDRQYLPHAHTRMGGVVQEWRWYPHPRQQVGVHAWWQRSRRAFPPTRVQSTSRAGQRDEDLRLAADWQWLGSRSRWQMRTGMLSSRLAYADTLSGVGSDSRSYTWLAEAEGNTRWRGPWQLKAGINSQFIRIISNAYDNRPEQLRLAAWTAVRFRPTDSWQAVITARQEQVDGKLIPIIPMLHLAHSPTEHLSWGASLGRSFRLPTFNDLYWPQGGNPDLRPEHGWQAAAQLKVQAGGKAWQHRWQLDLFENTLQDQIIWRPQDGIWQPENLSRSRSRGISVRWRAQYDTRHISLMLNVHYRFTRSFQLIENSRTADRLQSPYIPQHQSSVQGQLSYRHSRLRYLHRYTGRVWTLADASSVLPGYHLATIGLDHRIDYGRHQFWVETFVDNLWNADYEVVRHHPMPGRAWHLGIRYEFNKPSSVEK